MTGTCSLLESDVSEKYVPLKKNSVAYVTAHEKAIEQKKRSQLRAKRSRMAEFIVNEFGDKPEVISTSRVTGSFQTIADVFMLTVPARSQKREFDAEESELNRYEEDNFVRLDLKRAEIAKKRVFSNCACERHELTF